MSELQIIDLEIKQQNLSACSPESLLEERNNSENR